MSLSSSIQLRYSAHLFSFLLSVILISHVCNVFCHLSYSYFTTSFCCFVVAVSLRTLKIPTLKAFQIALKLCFLSYQFFHLPSVLASSVLCDSWLWGYLEVLQNPRPSASGLSLVCIWLGSRPGFSQKYPLWASNLMWMTHFWDSPLKPRGSAEGPTTGMWLRFLPRPWSVDRAALVYHHNWHHRSWHQPGLGPSLA